MYRHENDSESAPDTTPADELIREVQKSMEEVASSRISMGGRQSITRAMQSSCFWP